MFGMDAGTIIALVAMLITLSGALIKYVDRRRQLNKEKLETTKKQFNADVERDSLIVRGAEGALILMEKTLKTANEECEKRINELEEENETLKCELTAVRNELQDLRQQMKELTRRVEG